MPKYYAVKHGKNPGIYSTWTECQENVKGVSGSVFKSFSTLKEAEDFIRVIKHFEDAVECYTDGSFMNNKSGGACVFPNNKVYYGCVEGDHHTNNRGELYGILLACTYCESPRICIYTDSQYSINILQNGYSANQNNDLIEKIKKTKKEYRLVYVPAHTGIKYNEIADKYAKIACSLNPEQIETREIGGPDGPDGPDGP